ncbi:MAG: LysM peptidoglycan-binding domain-containing protein [Gammaproteobacteria bacterium]|jgi:membrane-bound lytic murein transglycosylase D
MRTACIALLVSGLGILPAFAQSDEFPQPESLRPAIEFWTRVYTEADTRSGYLHDSLHLEVVYEHLSFGENATSRQRRRATDNARRKYREILNRLAEGSHDELSAEERRVLELWPAGTGAREFSAAAGRLRFQLGQADRFLAGLRRSERWMPHIEAVLRDRGLPLELAVLPHVESSFTPTAYSRVGAAGLWQFTRSTGLRYMRIDHIVDERRDPFISTYAAARLLEDNYAVTQSWPLAITAYNHGLAGMRRAIDQLNSRDIGRVVAEYRGRTFGFASRNFYAAFAAALQIDRNPEQYFGDVSFDAPLTTSVIETTDYLSAATIADAAGVTVAELRSYNPALMDTVWEGDKLVPRGFPLRLPTQLAEPAMAALASVPPGARFARQYPDLQHRVARGDTVWEIAQRYNISVNALIRANGLSTGNLIRIGQVLTLPVDAGAAALADVTPSGGVYEVRRGDTMAVIARRFGVSTQTLLSANSLVDADRIFVGQNLQIPGVLADNGTAADETERAARAVTVAQVSSESSQTAAAALQPVDSQSRSLLEPIISTGVAVLRQIVSEAAAAEVPATIEIDLSADPSDYSVAGDGTIEVQAHETLGHYADWLEVRTQLLRDINGLPFERAVNYGQRIRLRFDTVDRATFERRRMQFQQQIQEDFFSVYHIDDVTEHVVRPGESLWILAQRRYNVPVWLLRQYNPDVDLDRINPGTVVKFPNLRRRADDA